MKIQKKIISISLLAFMLSILAVVPASAYTPTDMTKKALMQALNNCYEGGAFTEEFKTVGEYGGRDSLYARKIKNDGNLPLPTGNIFHKINDSDLSCKDVIKGYSGLGGSISDVFTYMGHSAPAKSASNVGNWLETYAGYKKNENLAEQGKCVRFKFTYSTGAWINSQGATTEETTDQICVDTIEDGVIKTAPRLVEDGGWNRTHGTENSYTSTKRNVFSVDANSGDFVVVDMKFNSTKILSIGAKWDDFVNAIVAEIPNTSMIFDIQASIDGASRSSVYAGKEVIVSGDSTGASGSYKIANKTTSAETAIKNLYGSTGIPRVTQEERVHIYMYYFETLYGAKISCSTDPDVATGNGYDGPIKWFESGKAEASSGCYVISRNSKSDKVNGVTDEGIFEHENVGYNELLDFFKTLSITELTDAATTNSEEAEEPEENAETEATCYDNAGSLGWILCPIIESLSNAIVGIYAKYITPFLVLDTELFKEGSGTYDAWKQFRDIANIAFIIFFVFVIFSQLTGIGIDNYGIKKILPKLIVGAVLINLSYIICQLAIDVANIVGYSIGGLLESVGEKVDYQTLSLAETGGKTWQNAGSATTILVVLVGLLCMGAFLAMGMAALIPVFMAVVSVFVAIFFAFVLLGVRKAFAVILVVVSPLAFACYMLPNTQSIFKKWFSAFKGVLLAFPICSAMIYGGQLVARIIITASGKGVEMPSTIALSAAVISIVPIFMIPKVISGSMTAISGITGRLAAMQRGATGRARGAVDKSRAAQIMRDNHQRRVMRNRSGFEYDENGNIKGLSKRGERQDRWAKTAGAKRRLAQRRAEAARASQAEANMVGLWTGDDGVERAKNMGAAATAQREAQEVSDLEAKIMRSNEADNISTLQNRAEDAMRHGDTRSMKAYTNILMKKGDAGRQAVLEATRKAQIADGEGKKMSDETTQALGSHMSNNYSADMKANSRAGYEFYQKAATGKRGSNGELEAGNLKDYNTIDYAKSFTADNLANMDDNPAEEITRSIDSGAASIDQVRHIDNAISDLESDKNIALKGKRRDEIEKMKAASFKYKSDNLTQLNEKELSAMSQRVGNMDDPLTVEQVNHLKKNIADLRNSGATLTDVQKVHIGEIESSIGYYEHQRSTRYGSTT